MPHAIRSLSHSCSLTSTAQPIQSKPGPRLATVAGANAAASFSTASMYTLPWPATCCARAMPRARWARRGALQGTAREGAGVPTAMHLMAPLLFRFDRGNRQVKMCNEAGLWELILDLRAEVGGTSGGNAI